MNLTNSALVTPYIYVIRQWFNVGTGTGLLPGRRQTITWTNTYLLYIESLGQTSS